MAARIVGLALLMVSALLASLIPGSRLFSAAVPEGSVQFQDGAGNVKESFLVGEGAIFYIRDADLSPPTTSVATWAQVPAQVPASSTWSLATGAPHQSVYSLSVESEYDTSTPADTPLSSKPTAKVNGVTTLVATFDAPTGQFTLLNDVNASSTLEVEFDFDAVDSYSGAQRRARVSSSSDADGEWVSVSEVASETDSGPSPTSGLFRGEVTLSGDSAAITSGDGAVWVREGDDVTAIYYASDGATMIDSHHLASAILTPSPTPTATSVSTLSPTSEAITTPIKSPESHLDKPAVPAMQSLALVIAALVFTLAITWQLRRASDALHSQT